MILYAGKEQYGIGVTLTSRTVWGDWVSTNAARYGAGLEGLEARDAYVTGWVRGQVLCELCRDDAGRTAANAVNDRLVKEKASAAAVLDQFRVETDPSTLIAMINQGVGGTPEDFVRAWRHIAAVLQLKPSHDVVALRARGYKGHGTPLEVSRTAVWELPQVLTTSRRVHDEVEESAYDGYLCPHGRIWLSYIYRRRTDGYLLPERDNVQEFVLLRGASIVNGT